MPRALLSVYDKTGLIGFAETLIDHGWELVASGGTEQTLLDAGLAVTPVDQLTKMPEMLGGRVKTLHPAIHAGILMRDNYADLNEISLQGFAPIDMVVCNLYPFQQTVARPGITLEEAIEQIDVGGVTLLRAAAKNFSRVITICDPNDYGKVAAEIRASGHIDIIRRKELATKAFAHTRDYDTAIHAFLSEDAPAEPVVDVGLPERISYALNLVRPLRYGENPHQSGGYYALKAGDEPFNAQQFGGKELSYNNILDIDAAWQTISSFTDPTVVVVKHLTPTGIASATSITEAYPHALASDPLSAFGCVMAVNQRVDESFVQALGSLFIEVIVAPGFTESAREALNQRRRNCRLIQMPTRYDLDNFQLRGVFGGFLIQQLDKGDPEGVILKTVTERAPTTAEVDALQFAWKAVQHVKSNAIVLAKPNRTVGIGGGLPSRVDAAMLAVSKAGDEAKGAVMASDALIPFPDGIEAVIDAGVTAVIQPGGAIRDKQVIEAANQANVAMVFTGTRHFKH